MGKKKRSEFGREDLPQENAFVALESLKGSLPKGEDRAGETTPAQSAPALAGKIVLARERSGRGGKTVTVVSGLRLDDRALEELVRRMRKALGTSGTVEGERIVLGGDITGRVEKWLREAGAKRVVIGN